MELELDRSCFVGTHRQACNFNFPKHVSADKWLIVIPTENGIVFLSSECLDMHLPNDR